MRASLALLGVLAACSNAGDQPGGAQGVPPRAALPEPEADVSVSARFVPLRAPETVHALEAAGRLLAPPNTRAELTMPLPSSVLHVRVAEGQRVERGEVLVELAVPEAARAAGQLEGARLRGEASRARLQHLEILQAEGLARGSELADARSRLAEAQAVEHEALAVLQTVEIAGLRRNGRRYDMISPLTGVVVEINAPLGSMRGPNDGPMIKIVGGSSTRVEARFAFPLPADASYELIAAETSTRKLRLVSQAPEVTAQDATRRAWFDSEQPIALPPGSPVRVRMLAPRDAFVVPSSALVRHGDKLLLRTRRAGPLQVELIAALGSEALVRGALVADDVVAEEGSPSRD